MNETFKILTDSACDMDGETIQKEDIYVIPLLLNIGDDEYGGFSGKTISNKDFFARLKSGENASTAQANVELIKLYMEKILKQGKDVLAISFSSGLSGTYYNYLKAKEELEKEYPDRKIIVVDSLCSSFGVAMLVWYAKREMKNDKSIEDTTKYLEDVKTKICHDFTASDLFYLKRGGRLSTASAVIGSVLKIKPLLHVSVDGKLTVVGKTMGRKKSLYCLLKSLQENNTLKDGDPLFVNGSNCKEDVEFLADLVKKAYPEREVITGEIGPVIGAHSGSDIIAVYYRGKRGEN